MLHFGMALSFMVSQADNCSNKDSVEITFGSNFGGFFVNYKIYDILADYYYVEFVTIINGIIYLCWVNDTSTKLNQYKILDGNNCELVFSTTKKCRYGYDHMLILEELGMVSLTI